MCYRAPACQAVLTQANELVPHRRTTSDGICASPKHTAVNPGSDHEPHIILNGKGYATAVDLSDDKAGGMDADAWAEHLRTTRDRRVKYVICNRRMFSSYPARGYPAWAWRPYTGTNPHETHTHLSILPAGVFDTAPWFPAPAPPPAPIPTPAIAELEELPAMYAFRDPDTRHVIAADGFTGRHVERITLQALIAAGAFGTLEHRRALGWTDHNTFGPASEPPQVDGLEGRIRLS